MSSLLVNLNRPLIVVVLLIGIILRIYGVLGDLWLDEIWSLKLVSESNSLIESLIIPHDNSHPLNSLWLYLCGQSAPFLLYRSFSFFCSILTLVMVWRWMPLILPEARTLAFVFASISYLLVLYGTEARGYGPMILFSILALRYESLVFSKFSKGALLKFIGALTLGFLSHLTFLHFFVALTLSRLIWALLHRKLGPVVICYLPIILLVAAYIHLRISTLTLGGGPQRSLWDTFISAISIGSGGGILRAADGGWSVAYTVLAILVYLIALIEAGVLWKKSERLSVLLIVLLIFVPASFLWLLAPKFSEPRYILFSVLATNFALVSFCARVWRRDLVGKGVATIFVSAYLIGNLAHDFELARYGRGSYSAALSFIKSNSKSWPTKIAAEHQFRVGTVAAFYAHQMGIIAPELVDIPSADWAIVDVTAEDEMPIGFTALSGFGSAPLSGAEWKIYRRNQN